MISRTSRKSFKAARAAFALFTLSAFLCLSLPGRAAPEGPRQCQDLKQHEARLKRAREALNSALGADAGRRGTAAGDAAAASAEALAFFSSFWASIYVFIPFWVGADVACKNAANNPDNPTAQADCDKAYREKISHLQRSQSFGGSWGAAHKRADKHLGELISSATAAEVRRAAEEMRGALRAAADDTAACAKALEEGGAKPPTSNARPQPGFNAVAGNIPIGTTFGGAPPNTFDADVLGFHVKLENGSVTRSGDTKLAGTVSVWPKNNPSLKMVVNGNVYVKGGSSPNAIYGDGKVELTSGGSGLAFTEGDFNTAPGGGSLTGVGKFQRYGHTFDASFTLSSQGSFSGQGEWRGRGKGWQSVPGVEAEYQVSNPLLKVSFSGVTASATLDTDKVEVRTKARNASGEHLAKAELNPDPVTVSADGRLQLPMPTLPPPPDPDRVAREACEATARELKQDAGPCRGKFPPPPGLPNLPRRVEVQVNVIIE